MLAIDSREFQPKFSLATGTAVAHEDFKPIRQLVTFGKGELVKGVSVEIVDDQQWEPDESFFLRLSVPATQRRVKLGRKSVMEVVIINDDGKLNEQMRNCI